ncbi:MAG: DNA alkylation repair protein [Eubacterium sp.]|nr:DNA alkylation repair protein [Eubacterium sp.]
MITDEIREELFKLQDLKYRDFQVKLIPGMDSDHMIGVRTPDLRRLAKQMSGRADISEFLNDLPHTFFEEDQLHAFIVSGMKDYDECMNRLEIFLPYVDNWATCDQMSPKIFRKHKAELLVHIRVWIRSTKVYTLRFGVSMLMQHFLDEDFDRIYPEMVAHVRSDEYYVRMMIAWYFATAIAKQYDEAITYLEHQSLDTWTHNKTIQKAVESFRVTPEHKAYLKTLRIR